jgi:hypothetical protein
VKCPALCERELPSLARRHAETVCGSPAGALPQSPEQGVGKPLLAASKPAVAPSSGDLSRPGADEFRLAVRLSIFQQHRPHLKKVLQKFVHGLPLRLCAREAWHRTHIQTRVWTAFDDRGVSLHLQPVVREFCWSVASGHDRQPSVISRSRPSPAPNRMAESPYATGSCSRHGMAHELHHLIPKNSLQSEWSRRTSVEGRRLYACHHLSGLWKPLGSATG